MPAARKLYGLLAFDTGAALLAMALIWPGRTPVWLVGVLLGVLWVCGAYRDKPCELPARAGLAGLVVCGLGVGVRTEFIAPFLWLALCTFSAIGIRYWWWRQWPRRLAHTWQVCAPPAARQRFKQELAEYCPAARITDNPAEATARIAEPSAVGALTVAQAFERFWFKLPLARQTETWPQPIAAPPEIKGVGYFSRLCGLFGLLLALPILALAAAGVFVISPGPVLYRQTRIGLGGRPFVMLKLRTMQLGAEETGVLWSPPEDPRILPGTRWLRATHLDELPQLWNLARGEMALVGPRPERPEFVPELTREIPCYDLRHRIPPGITGWAQVMHPYGSSVEDARRKCEYDLYYLKHRSWALDVLVLFETALAVLGARGR